jgi:ribonuclease HII
MLEHNSSAGIDEAGLGCLFGNAVACCVVLPLEFPDDTYKQIKDSKKLSPKKREFLASYIKQHALTYGFGYTTHEEIDSINILQAKLKAMNRATIQAYEKYNFQHIIVDGNQYLPFCPSDDIIIPYVCIPGADNSYLNVAAASILAKTHRDQLIQELVDQNTELEIYGLRKNKGYGTKAHMDAIKQFGLTQWHRKTFIHFL